MTVELGQWYVVSQNKKFVPLGLYKLDLPGWYNGILYNEKTDSFSMQYLQDAHLQSIAKDFNVAPAEFEKRDIVQSAFRIRT